MAKIDRLFQYLVSSGGSDLHLSEGAPPKVRVHGGVSVIPEEAMLDGEDFKELLSEICEPGPFAQYLECGDLDLAYDTHGPSRLRCHSMRQQI